MNQNPERPKRYVPTIPMIRSVRFIRNSPKGLRDRIMQVLYDSKCLDGLNQVSHRVLLAFWDLLLDPTVDWVEFLPTLQKVWKGDVEEITKKWSDHYWEPYFKGKSIKEGREQEQLLIRAILEVSMAATYLRAVPYVEPPKGWTACSQDGLLLWIKESEKSLCKIKHLKPEYCVCTWEYELDPQIWGPDREDRIFLKGRLYDLDNVDKEIENEIQSLLSRFQAGVSAMFPKDLS